jgi:hypothetical protein
MTVYVQTIVWFSWLLHRYSLLGMVSIQLAITSLFAFRYSYGSAGYYITIQLAITSLFTFRQGHDLVFVEVSIRLLKSSYHSLSIQLKAGAKPIESALDIYLNSNSQPPQKTIPSPLRRHLNSSSQSNNTSCLQPARRWSSKHWWGIR